MLGLPALFGEDFLANVADIVESAAERAFGAGFVAIKEFERVEICSVPGGGAGFLCVQLGFLLGVNALMAEKIPAGDDGVDDEAGVLRVSGLVLLERAFEEGEEVCGRFAGEDQRFGGGAVAEMIKCRGGTKCGVFG